MHAPQVGLLTPEPTPTGRLCTGQVGYVITGMKSARAARVGDTWHRLKQPVPLLPGFKPSKSMVFAGGACHVHPLRCPLLPGSSLNDPLQGISKGLYHLLLLIALRFDCHSAHAFAFAAAMQAYTSSGPSEASKSAWWYDEGKGAPAAVWPMTQGVGVCVHASHERHPKNPERVCRHLPGERRGL